MAEIRPFACVRPCREKAAKIAALPYDVYNRKEAKEEVLREPESFLKIDRAETQFDDSGYLCTGGLSESPRYVMGYDSKGGFYQR